jgi:hypothetical protein
MYNTLQPILTAIASMYLNLKKSCLCSMILKAANTTKPSNIIETAGLIILSILAGSKKSISLIAAAMAEVRRIELVLFVCL